MNAQPDSPSAPSAAPLPRRIPLTLGSPRLWLRFPRADDWRALQAYFGDADSVRYTTRRAFSEAETWRTVAGAAGHWALRGYGPYVIERRDDGAVLGLCGPWYPNDWPEPEIKWSLVPAARGQGFAAEAARTALATVRMHLGLRPISLIDAENAASIALARRVGARFESSIEFRGRPAHIYRHADAAPPPDGAQLRPASVTEAEPVTTLFIDTHVRHLPFLPRPPRDKIVPMMRDIVLPAGRTWVLDHAGELLAMLTLADGDDGALWIRHLYVAEAAVGRGLGTHLLAFALGAPQRGGRPVRLWTFQANAGARRFYERHGFMPLRFTDGRDNIERCPDVLYELA